MAAGRLALWNDCLAQYAEDYEAWYAGEHLPERLGLPGWLRGRRYEAVGSGPQFFTYYEVEAPTVLVSGVYLERVNNPTPLTHRIMSDAFRNMSRTVCTVERVFGAMRGAWAVTLDRNVPLNIDRIADQAGVARVELWREAQVAQPAENVESRLRGGDTTVQTCLFAETLRRADAERIAASRPGARIYRFLCELEAPRP